MKTLFISVPMCKLLEQFYVQVKLHLFKLQAIYTT